MTMAEGGYLWMARIGWMLLAILCVRNTSYQLRAFFFFSALFVPSGFAYNSFFTLKHFHIILFISITIQTLYGQIGKILQAGVQKATLFYPVIGMIVVASLAALIHGGLSSQVIKTTGNFSVIVFAMIYMSGLILRHLDSQQIERNALFFLWGVAAQILIAFGNLSGIMAWGNYHVLHNNHVGVLASFSVFYGLGFIFSSRTFRRTALALTLIVFSGLALSCSRTAWINFIFPFGVFVILAGRHLRTIPMTSRVFFRYVFFVCSIILTAIAIYSESESVRQRLLHIFQLFDVHSWQFAFQDTQNFGFLGYSRRLQFYQVSEIFKWHPLIGVGFQKHLVEFHCFYLTVLGASGLFGLFLFLTYIFSVLKNLLKVVYGAHPQLSCQALGVLCAALSWYGSSLMETLFVQYSSWIHGLLAVVILNSLCQSEIIQKSSRYQIRRQEMVSSDETSTLPVERGT